MGSHTPLLVSFGVFYSLSTLEYSLVSYRTVGPSVGTIILAWSLNNGRGYPVNYFFSFSLLSLILLVNVGVCFLFPKDVDKSSPKSEQH